MVAASFLMVLILLVLRFLSEDKSLLIVEVILTFFHLCFFGFVRCSK